MSDSKLSVQSLLAPVPSHQRDFYSNDQDTRALLANSVHEHDEDVIMAVQALGTMRHHRAIAPPPPLQVSISNGTTPPLTVSPSSAPSTATETGSQFVFGEDTPADFVSRMAELPLVNSALRVYEHGKASSRVVKFGAEMMESSMLTVTKPVLNRLPVDQLDDFACRQLDRFSSRFKPSHPDADVNNGSQIAYNGMRDDADRRSPAGDDPRSACQTNSDGSSRWHSVLAEASGIGVAVSAESMRRLKYCIQWLQYATERIDNQIAALQDTIESQSRRPSTSRSAASPASPSRYAIKIQKIKDELLLTIRQVVEIMSQYAGGALPEPARSTVRDFILMLPQRWAKANATAVVSPEDARTAESSSPAKKGGSRSRGTKKHRSQGSTSSIEGLTPRSAHAGQSAAAQKLLTLATESLETLKNVTSVFNQSLERAETWVERLRVVGVDRQGTRPNLDTTDLPRSTSGRSSPVSELGYPTPTTPLPVHGLPRPCKDDMSEDEELPPKKAQRVDKDL